MFLSSRKKAALGVVVAILLVGLGFFSWQIKTGKILSKADTLPQIDFSDVRCDSEENCYWAYDQIQELVKRGIIKGYPDGTFRPEEIVTRSQLAVYLARTLAGGDGQVPKGPSVSSFPDVSTSSTAYKYIEFCKTRGVIGGYPDGKFKPDEQVSRSQISVFISRALNSGNYQNLIANSSFEQRTNNDFNGWTESAASPSAYSADTDKYIGTVSAKMSVVNAAAASIQATNSIPIRGNTPYTLSYYGKSSDATRGVYYVIKDDQNYCYHSGGWDTNCGSNWPTQILANSWQRYAVQFTTRASATRLALLRFARSGPGSYNINLDAIQLELNTSATAYGQKEGMTLNETEALVPAGPATPSFTDVPATNLAYKFVEYLKSKDVIAGYENNTFKPDEKVTRAQVAVFIARAWGFKPDYSTNVHGQLLKNDGTPLANGYMIFDGDIVVQADANGYYPSKTDGGQSINLDIDAGEYEIEFYDQNGAEFGYADPERHLLDVDNGDQTINFTGLIAK